MSLLTKRTHNYREEHFKLEKNGTKIICSHCKKVVEEREEMPDYAVFMGPVWIKQNLPCSRTINPKINRSKGMSKCQEVNCQDKATETERDMNLCLKHFTELVYDMIPLVLKQASK